MASGYQAQVAIKVAQNARLIPPDDDTLWKTTYSRHTNLAVGNVDSLIDGNGDFPFIVFGHFLS